MTLDSRFSFGDGGIMGDLTELTLIAEDFGEEPDSEFATQLVELGRKVVFQDDCTVRVGGVDAKVFEGRMYILSDLIILGKYKKSKKKGKKTLSTIKGATRDKIVFGADKFNTRDDMTEADLDEARTLRARAGLNLKLKLWVNLEGSGVQVRDFQKGDNSGIRIIYTTKEMEEIDGDMEMVTNVDQTEVFFESEEMRSHFAVHIHDAIDSLLEKQLGDIDGLSLAGATLKPGRQQSMGASASFEAVEPVTVDGTETEADDGMTVRSNSTSRTGKARGFTKGKATMKKIQRHRNKGKSLTGKGDDGPLTLNDLENKYKINFTPKAQVDLAKFSVSFKQGSMGLALSSNGTSGVFVGKIEENGMADASGVTLGDRVLEIGGTTIPDEMAWQDCIGIIKEKRGLLTPEGKPKPLVIKFARMKDVEENIAKKKEQKKQNELKARVKKARERRGGARQWKTKRAQGKNYGTRLKSLADLADKYKNRGEVEKTQTMCDDLFEKIIQRSKDKQEKKCGYILQEIYNTEKKYVADLYMLQDEYITKLTMKQVPMTCREKSLSTGGKFCEHNISARNCTQMSSQKKKLITLDDKKVMFINVETITKLNEELLKTLQAGLMKLAKKSEAGAEVDVTDVVRVFSPAFSRLMPYYALYSQYAARYAKAIDRLQSLRATVEEFDAELQDIERKKGVKGLFGLLITPVSRLTKYPLLFKTLTEAIRPHIASLTTEIINNKGGDIDKLVNLVDELEKTNQTVEKIASNVDFKVDEASKNDNLIEIYQDLGGVKYIQEFFKPSRKFVGRFEDVSYSEKKGKVRKNKVLLVFNDLLIIGGYRKGAKQTLQPSSAKATTRGSVRGSNKSVISRGESRAGKSKTGKGLFGIGGKKSAPLIKIEYMSNMKKVKVVPTPNNDGFFVAQCYLTSMPRTDDDEGVKTKRKKVSAIDNKPSVIKLDVLFETEKDRDLFLANINEEKDNLREKEERVKDAKETMSNARSAMRANRRRLEQKATLHGNAAAALSTNRQADLRAKLMEQRKKKSQQKKG